MIQKLGITIFIFVILGAGPAVAQRKSKKAVGPIRATVTVKAPPASKNVPANVEPIWTAFETSLFRLDFPVGNEEVESTSRYGLVAYEAFKLDATFGVIVKYAAIPLDSRGVDNLYDILTATIYDRATTKIISQKTVHCGDIKGRELVLEKGASRVFGRMFVHDNHFFIVSVILGKSDYSPDFDALITRFFGSFAIKSASKSEG